MKQLLFVTALFLFFPYFIQAQGVGIGAQDAAPDPSAMLDIQADDKGLLIPRVALKSSVDVETIQKPATSLLVYNTANVDDLTTGFYYFNGSAWTPISQGSASELALTPRQLDFLQVGSMPPVNESAGTQVLTTTPSGTLAWAPALAPAASAWLLNGNAGTNSTNFIGTTDAQALNFRTNNINWLRLTTKVN